MMRSKWNQGLVVTALELTQAKSNATQQVNASVDALWREEKYGHAPQEKSAHFIQLVMEDCNSLPLHQVVPR
jgi:hypothetical protein